MPQLAEAETLRQQARDLLRSSCYLPQVRDAILQTYSADAEAVPLPPESKGASARVLFADPELRSSVSAWTEQNLEGWRVVHHTPFASQITGRTTRLRRG